MSRRPLLPLLGLLLLALLCLLTVTPLWYLAVGHRLLFNLLTALWLLLLFALALGRRFRRGSDGLRRRRGV